jgi:hypothetical protein
VRRKGYAAPGIVTDMGTIVLAASPGSVTGHIKGLTPEQLDSALVSIPRFGLVAIPNATGRYLLVDVPQGTRDLVLAVPGRPPVTRRIEVSPYRTTTGVDLGGIRDVPASTDELAPSGQPTRPKK